MLHVIVVFYWNSHYMVFVWLSVFYFYNALIRIMNGKKIEKLINSKKKYKKIKKSRLLKKCVILATLVSQNGIATIMIVIYGVSGLHFNINSPLSEENTLRFRPLTQCCECRSVTNRVQRSEGRRGFHELMNSWRCSTCKNKTRHCLTFQKEAPEERRGEMSRLESISIILPCLSAGKTSAGSSVAPARPYQCEGRSHPFCIFSHHSLIKWASNMPLE